MTTLARKFGADRVAGETTPAYVIVLIVVLMLIGLPIAVWLDLRNISEQALHTEAAELNSLITSIRGYYAKNVVERVLASPGTTKVINNYHDVPGAIPIPATLSLELGQVIGEQQSDVSYRFVSDYPFAHRTPHKLDAFELQALATLRQNPGQPIVATSGSLFDSRVRLIAPVIMGAGCVSCHNSHPESPKRDWKVGDVRGIQEITVDQSLVRNIAAFKYLLTYFTFTAMVGFGFIGLQRSQAAAIRLANKDLEEANNFLASVSMKISKYLSPQIYKSIFSGQKDVSISTERKKLTIFFSDIKDFTATSERLQPEELTALLNEYLTDMSTIAANHGATIDKFIGDAILAFFGDPESKGVVEDATACLRMAIDMQRRLAELNANWRERGVEQPFRVRMGINTGFCNVGNFGSADRMDYTIIGAEANLAARLQAIAEPGSIVMSFETYALVRDIVQARSLPPITVKGLSREIQPFVVEGLKSESGAAAQIFNEHATGLDFFMDINVVDEQAAARVRSVLQQALSALEGRKSTA
jgi:adenylate cyclase